VSEGRAGERLGVSKIINEYEEADHQYNNIRLDMTLAMNGETYIAISDCPIKYWVVYVPGQCLAFTNETDPVSHDMGANLL
jgi:hypothetical protein